MSKTPKNKKFLELQGIRVYHNKKDNTIQLITTDPDLTGQPFQITLSNGTPTDQSIRNLLIEKHVITEEEAYPQNYIPRYAKHPNIADDNTPSAPYPTQWDEILIGLDKNNNQVTLPLQQAPHTLITGAAGQGKTILQNNFLLHALQHPTKWKICAISPNKYDFTQLDNHPDNLYGKSTNIKDSITLLHKLETTLKERYQQMGDAKVTNFQDLPADKKGNATPAIMVIINDVSYLQDNTPPDNNQIKETLNNLSRLGRAAGIYLVLSTQQPHAQIFTGELKANLSNRIAVGKMDKISSNLTLGTDAATLTPKDIKGRAILRTYKTLKPFQIYFVPTEKI